jgi:hypothetical protein
MKDYYRILQITPDASQEEVKKAYRRLAKVHHPDIAGNGERQEIFIQDINEAYRTLSHPEKRSRYDWIRTNREIPQQETTTSESYFQEKQRHPYGFNRGAFQQQVRERELVKPYLGYTYAVSRISLVFCLLLAIDFLMPLRQRTDKVTYLTEVHSKSGEFEKHEYTQLHTWKGSKAFVANEASLFFKENPTVLLFRTRLFGKLRYIAPAQAVKQRFINSRSIYGNFIFIPALLLLTAFFGSLKYFKPELDFSFGVASGVLLFICSILLLV